MNKSSQVKTGYKYVLNEPAEPVSRAHMYNVPNPPSDVAENVTRDEIKAAISAHRETSTAHVNALDESTKKKVLAVGTSA